MAGRHSGGSSEDVSVECEETPPGGVLSSHCQPSNYDAEMRLCERVSIYTQTFTSYILVTADSI